MRILLIAPDQPGLDTIPEIRIITQRHHATLLNGTVTAADVYRECRATRYQIIHFATHSNAEMVALSAGETMNADDIAQIDRMSGAECIMFNSCLSSRLAAHCVAHGALYCICANVALPDKEAWKFPAAFYSALTNGHSRDVVGAFAIADSGNGDYGLSVSLAVYQQLTRTIEELKAKVLELTTAPTGIADSKIGVKWSSFATQLAINGMFLVLIVYLLLFTR